MRCHGLTFNRALMTESRRTKTCGVAVLLAIMFVLAGCEILTLHATGGNRGVEGAAVGMKL
ncbi:MAG: hypothetical protein CL569_04480 [Alphaproteobacteria bacterium]|nr:hypothetical protein [Alphaproteobacteria bacterium]